MPADQLVDQVAGDVVDVEPAVGAASAADPGVEDHLQQDVAQLLAHGHRVVVDDRVVGLVRLLEQVAAQRGVRLLGVPRAAAGRAQPVHDGDDVQQPGPRGLGAPVDDRGGIRQRRPRSHRTTTSSVLARRHRGVGDVGHRPALGAQRRRGGGGAGQRDQRPPARRPRASRPRPAGRAGGD